MKKLVFLFVLASVGCTVNSYAQEEKNDSKVKETTKEVASDVKEGVKESAHEVKEVGKDVGNKTAEVSVKAVSEIKDKKLKNKVGPDGQTVYEDRYGNYYWVNDKGRKIYLTEARLKSK